MLRKGEVTGRMLGCIQLHGVSTMSRLHCVLHNVNVTVVISLEYPALWPYSGLLQLQLHVVSPWTAGQHVMSS